MSSPQPDPLAAEPGLVVPAKQRGLTGETGMTGLHANVEVKSGAWPEALRGSSM